MTRTPGDQPNVGEAVIDGAGLELSRRRLLAAAVAEIAALGQKALAANDKGRHSKRRLCDELGAALLGAGRLLTPLESALAIA